MINFVSKEDCENKCGSQAQPHSVEDLLEPLLPHQSYSLDDLPNEELKNNSPYYNNGQASQNLINELLSVEPSGQKNKLGTYYKKSNVICLSHDSITGQIVDTHAIQM